MAMKLDFSGFAKSEPNWLTGDLGVYPAGWTLPSRKGIYQQSDLLKPMLDDVVNYGLNYTYQKYKGAALPISGEESFMAKPPPKKYSKTSNSKHVIIVGAGLAGLSAAYELTKVGHEVDILEMQNIVGGRVKTLRERDGFSKHCHTEAGAMRLPNLYNAENKTHYLTDYYAAKEFNLKLGPFNNYDENAWLKFYGKEKIRISEWKAHSTKYCNEFWEGWDSKFQNNTKVQVEDIDDYFKQTTKIVTDQLKKKLNAIKDGQGKEKKMAKVWDDWINNWSNFSLIGFLQNTKDGVLQLLDEDHQLDAKAARKLHDLIPWPDAAIKAYSVYSYTEQLDQSLVQYLRDDLGNWWSHKMHRIVEGTSKLPQAFVKERVSTWPDHAIINLKEKVTFHVKVDEIAYAAENHDDFQSQKVTVRGKYVSSGKSFEIHGDAVIVTVPLHIVRQIRFVPANYKTEAPKTLTEIYKSLEDIWQGPATKIMLQYKERFWESKPDDIHGGFSKTSLPIGQLHYPTVDADTKSKRGILMCYTWKSEALMFAALKPHDAINEAVSQVARIHPGSDDYFEVGAIQAWTNEPYAQGAYALLKPHQYVNVRNLMIKPCLNMFFAGDGISFAAGWMQGALESGLRAAYQFYCRNEMTSR